MEAQADWVTKEELRAAQAQDRKEIQELAPDCSAISLVILEMARDRKEIQELAQQLAKLEGQFGESVRATDKHGATKADIEAVRSDIRLLRYGLFIGLLLLLSLWGDLTLSDVLRFATAPWRMHG